MRQLVQDLRLIGLGCLHVLAMPLGWIGGGTVVVILAELTR